MYISLAKSGRVLHIRQAIYAEGEHFVVNKSSNFTAAAFLQANCTTCLLTLT